MEIPRNFAAEVNKIVLDFIWKQKPAKIKRTTLVKTKSDGGLGMKDCSLHDSKWKGDEADDHFHKGKVFQKL